MFDAETARVLARAALWIEPATENDQKVKRAPMVGAVLFLLSYRRAWLLVESLKRTFRERVTVASKGGKDGGGMLVTEFGDALIKNYRDLERDFEALAERRLHPITATVIQHSKSGARVSLRPKLD
jgi:molybdate transport repressor ModE-like protein